MFAGVAGKVEKFIYDILYCFEFLVQVATKSILLLTCRSCPESSSTAHEQQRAFECVACQAIAAQAR